MNKFLVVSLISANYLIAQDSVSMPSGRINVNGINLFVEGELLYWKAYEDGLFYAQSGSGAGSADLPPKGAVGDDFIGEFQKVKPGYDLGYRVTLGYGFDHDKEDLRVSYLNFKTRKKDETEGASLDLWGHSYNKDLNYIKYASCSWHLFLRSLEADFGKSFFWSDHLIIRPAVGLVAAKIDQHLAINYTYDVPSSRKSVLCPYSDIKGIGTKGVLDGQLHFSKNFSIYALGSYALLYSKVNADFSQSEDGHNIARSYDKWNLGVTALKAALGLEFDLYFAADKCHLGLRCGVEDNFWIGVNQMNHYLYRLSEGNLYQGNGNLNLSGLTFNARLDF